MKICKTCGAEILEGNIFCMECGAPVSVNKCPRCGEILPERAKFCGKCGNKITEAEPPQPEIEPPQPKVNVKITRLSRDENIGALVHTKGIPQETPLNFSEEAAPEDIASAEEQNPQPEEKKKVGFLLAMCITSLLIFIGIEMPEVLFTTIFVAVPLIVLVLWVFKETSDRKQHKDR